MSKRLSRAELEAENRTLRRGGWVVFVTSTANRLITMGGSVAIAYLVYSSIAVLSGETTTAEIGVNFLGDLRISESLAWLLALLGSGYGVAQRQLRRRSERRNGHRIRQLETKVDPGRSSSGLVKYEERSP